MQHEDGKRAALIERRKRQREEHLQWKAIMFPSRPPPPFVPPTHVEPWTPPSHGSASLVARIRRQPFAQVKESAPDTSASCSTELSTSNADVSTGREARQRAVKDRLSQEYAEWKPHMDARRTPISGCTIGVFRLPKTATDDDLRRFGERFGRVARARIVRNEHSADRSSRGYGFIQFSYERERDRAIRECNDPSIARPRVCGQIVAVEAERGRLGGVAHVPSRFGQIAAEATPQSHTLTSSSSELTSNDPSNVPIMTADDVLDNLDDFFGGDV